jgi:hypothetical protein
MSMKQEAAESCLALKASEKHMVLPADKNSATVVFNRIIAALMQDQVNRKFEEGPY